MEYYVFRKQVGLHHAEQGFKSDVENIMWQIAGKGKGGGPAVIPEHGDVVQAESAGGRAELGAVQRGDVEASDSEGAGR